MTFVDLVTGRHHMTLFRNARLSLEEFPYMTIQAEASLTGYSISGGGGQPAAIEIVEANIGIRRLGQEELFNQLREFNGQALHGALICDDFTIRDATFSLVDIYFTKKRQGGFLWWGGKEVIDRWSVTLWYRRSDRSEVKPQRSAQCVGCQNYYGMTHGGNKMTCAIYPDGPVDEVCLDHRP